MAASAPGSSPKAGRRPLSAAHNNGMTTPILTALPGTTAARPGRGTRQLRAGPVARYCGKIDCPGDAAEIATIECSSGCPVRAVTEPGNCADGESTGGIATVCRWSDPTVARPARSRFGRTSQTEDVAALTEPAGPPISVTSSSDAADHAALSGEPRPGWGPGGRWPCCATTSLLLQIDRLSWTPCFRGGATNRYAGCRRARSWPNRPRPPAADIDRDVIGLTLLSDNTNRQAGAGGNVTVSIPRM